MSHNTILINTYIADLKEKIETAEQVKEIFPDSVLIGGAFVTNLSIQKYKSVSISGSSFSRSLHIFYEIPLKNNKMQTIFIEKALGLVNFISADFKVKGYEYLEISFPHYSFQNEDSEHHLDQDINNQILQSMVEFISFHPNVIINPINMPGRLKQLLPFSS